jgi:hypothetical protein
MIGISAPVTFTRPSDTTQYAAGDLVANDVDAGDVTPMTFNCGSVGRGRATVKRARLLKTGTGITAASFILHLFGTLPTVANGDNGAFTPVSVASYLGPIPIDMSSGAVIGSSDAVKFGAPSPEINFDVTKAASANRKLYGLLAAAGTYTPESAEVFELQLEFSVED